MSALPRISAAFALLLCLAHPVASSAGEQRSISTSRQFLVYGVDPRLRGAICDLAEQTKSHLLRLLDQHDRWETPLIIKLDYPQANFPDAPGARLDVSQLGYGLKMQLNLLVTAEMSGRDVQRQLLRTILIEMMYRDRGNIAVGTPYVTGPEWLVEGVLALQPGRDADENAQVLQRMVGANKIASLASVVGQARVPLDAPSRKLFDAYSEALLQLLLETPKGKQKLGRFIRDLPAAPNNPVADLCAHFPETLGRSPDKWWALSVARLSASNRYQMLSATETAALLDHVLRFLVAGSDGKMREYSLGDYQSFRKLPGSEGVLAELSRKLLLFGARAHPFYRAIVQEDYELAKLLARGKTRLVSERLSRVASQRAVIEQQASEIDDYLNWYEATQPKTMSGAFAQVLREASAADSSQPRRRDPISVYLDSIEIEMH
jgi:hypothetical protein